MFKNIVHIDVSDFQVAVERVNDPQLREKPVVVAIEKAQRSFIQSVSKEAREDGIFPGMGLEQARRYCKNLVVKPPDADLYARATMAFIKVLHNYSPIVEPIRYGHAWLDMTGTQKLFGNTKDVAAKLQIQIENDLRLPTKAGVASNKLVSKVATDFLSYGNYSDQLYDINHGDEQPFLAPLHVNYLPNMKRQVRQELLDLNIKIIRELAVVSVENLQMVFGRFGVLLHQRAHGIDNRLVLPPTKKIQVVEQESLEQDSNDYHLLRSRIFTLLYKGARQLRLKKSYVSKLKLTIIYSDNLDETVSQKIKPTDDENELVGVVQEMFDRALKRRTRIKKITLRFSDLIPVPNQLSLFQDNQNPKDENLIKALDKIKDRFGEKSIQFGRSF